MRKMMAISNRVEQVSSQAILPVFSWWLPGRGNHKGVFLSQWSHRAQWWHRMSDPKPDTASHSAVELVRFLLGRAWLGGISVFDNSLTLTWHRTSAELWWYNAGWSQINLLWTLLWSGFEACHATLASETILYGGIEMAPQLYGGRAECSQSEVKIVVSASALRQKM